MKEKIDWYQEVLELEPSSKVFFPLARLLAESGQLEKAVLTLRQGLERHPEFMEARLYFVDLLFRTGQTELCQRQVRQIAPLLAKYAGFWNAWGHTLSNTDEDSDASLAASFLAASFQHSGLTLAQVMERGLRELAKDSRAVTLGAVASAHSAHNAAAHPVTTPSAPPPPLETKPDSPARSVAHTEGSESDDGDDPEERFSIRTRTMADVLAEQGDYASALEIYHELLTQASNPDEAAEINYRISTLTSHLGAMDQVPAISVESPTGKHRVLTVLEALAERLESRVHG